jgi:hypothetical protein
MAPGKYRAPGMPSAVQKGTPSGRRAAAVRTFGGTPVTVDGITREAMGGTSLLGAAIPKGIAAATIGTSHATAASDLTNSQASAQADIAETLAQLAALSKSRALRAVARGAEREPATSTALSVQSPRMLAHGRGPLVIVLSMTPGDVNRVVSMFERFGYTINRAFTPPRLDAMTKFTYWKTDGAVVLGNVPQEKRQTIAQAFDRGTTVWTTLADIGTDVTSSNAPTPGFTY